MRKLSRERIKFYIISYKDSIDMIRYLQTARVIKLFNEQELLHMMETQIQIRDFNLNILLKNNVKMREI